MKKIFTPNISIMPQNQTIGTSGSEHSTQFTMTDYPEDLRKYLSDVSVIDRRIVMIVKDWLMDVCKVFIRPFLVLQRCFEFIDRFARRVNISRSYFQLAGAVCLLISDSLFTMDNTSMDDMVYVCDGSYTKDEFRDMFRIFLLNVRLDVSPVDLFNPREPGKKSFCTRKTVERVHNILKLKALITLDTTEYSLSDILCACEGLLEDKREEGLPVKLQRVMLEPVGSLNNRYLYNESIVDLRVPSSDMIDSYQYSVVEDLDAEPTGFQLDDIDHSDVLIGNGSYGHIWESDGRSDRVVKCCNPDCDDLEVISVDFLRELRCYQIIKSDYVAKYFRSSTDRLEIEKCGNSLWDIKENGGFGEYQKKGLDLQIIMQLSRGLKDIHDSGIIHADLSHKNVMMDENCNVKIIDFGTAQFISVSKYLYDRVQNPLVLSPEVSKSQGIPSYDYKVDVWSFGCVCYSIYEGYLMKGVHDLLCISEMTEKISKLRCPVSRTCLSFDPNDRPSSSEVLKLLEDSGEEVCVSK